MTKPRISPTHLALVSILFIGIAAIAVTLIAETRYDVWNHRHESIAQQKALLSGDLLPYDGELLPYREARNRVFFPALLTTISLVIPQLAPTQVWMLLRAITALVMMGTLFFSVLRLTRRVDLAMLSVFLHVVAVALTMNFPWTHPWDFLDSAFFFACAVLSLGPGTVQDRITLAGLVALAALNRESSAMAGVVWLACRGWRIKPLEVAFALLLFVIGYGVAIGVRAVYGIDADVQFDYSLVAAVADFWTLLRSELLRPTFSSSGLLWLCLAGIGGGLVSLGWSDGRVRSLTAAAIILVLASTPFANPVELRPQIPSVSLLVLAGLLAINERWPQLRTQMPPTEARNH